MDRARERVMAEVPAVVALRVEAAVAGWRACELAWRSAEFDRRVDEAAAAGLVGAEERRRIGVAVRRDASEIRRGRWPTVDELVERALSGRLGEADVRGPWPPLTAVERAQLRRPGRRKHTSYAKYAGIELDDRVTATLPADLVWQARTAACRWNEREVAPRIAEAGEDPAECAEIYATYGQSLGRLVREALDRHLRLPPAEPDPNATVAEQPSAA